jgi:hemerythrin
MNNTADHPSLGLPEMDAQHAYLYSLFDRIESANADKMKELLREIEGYLLFHFSSEEHLMRHYKFPGFAVHSSDHEAAGTRLVRFLDDFDAARLNPAALRIFLIGWLSEHSKISDSQYAEWIKNCREKISQP